MRMLYRAVFYIFIKTLHTELLQIGNFFYGSISVYFSISRYIRYYLFLYFLQRTTTYSNVENKIAFCNKQFLIVSMNLKIVRKY